MSTLSLVVVPIALGLTVVIWLRRVWRVSSLSLVVIPIALGLTVVIWLRPELIIGRRRGVRVRAVGVLIVRPLVIRGRTVWLLVVLGWWRQVFVSPALVIALVVGLVAVAMRWAGWRLPLLVAVLAVVPVAILVARTLIAPVVLV